MRLLKYFLLLLPFQIFSQDQTTLERVLRENQRIGEMIKLYESNPDYVRGAQAVDKFLKDKSEERLSRAISANSSIIYEGNVDDKPCSHCPPYFKLIRSVNDVLTELPKKEKMSIHDENELTLQLNKLNFLYYVTKEIDQSNDIKCNKWRITDPIRDIDVSKFNTSLLAEKLVGKNEISSMQYIPFGNEKEIVYYYRGSGANSDKLIEVIMKKNEEKAIVRYYQIAIDEYSKTVGDDLPDLGSSARLKLGQKKQDDSKDKDGLKFDIVTKKTIIPTDIEFLESKNVSKLSNDFSVETTTQLRFNEQSSTMNFQDDKGKSYFVVAANNKTLGDTTFRTIIPAELSLGSSTDDLTVRASLEKEVVKDYSVSSATKKESDKVFFALTDHNNEYLKAEIVQDNKGKRSVELSNRTDLGTYGSITTVYQYDNRGNKSYMIGKETDLGNYGTLTTRYGLNQDKKSIFQLKHEKKIAENATISLGVDSGNGKETMFVFQVQSRF